MGQPVFQIKDLIAREGVVTISSNLQLYGDISERVMSYLRGHVPAIEIYSIDEAFLDFEGFELSELERFGRELSRKIKHDVGIPVSIGITPTKTLSKIASKLCKSYPKLQGACLMYRDEDIQKVLSKLPVGDVWGIGRRSVRMLSEYNIRTAEAFRTTPSEWIKAQMGVVGLRIWRELHGESCIEIDMEHSARQSIMVSRTFHRDEHELSSLLESVAKFASMASEKLRKQNSLCSQMQVFIETNRHRSDLPQHREDRIVSFTTPSDSTLEIVRSALEVVRVIYRKGYGYKKAGVVLLGFSNNSGIQVSMFDTLDRSKHRALMEVMDRINSEMGRSTLKLCVEGEGGASSLSQKRSPNYKTDWSDILTVKV